MNLPPIVIAGLACAWVICHPRRLLAAVVAGLRATVHARHPLCPACGRVIATHTAPEMDRCIDVMASWAERESAPPVVRIVPAPDVGRWGRVPGRPMAPAPGVLASEDDFDEEPHTFGTICGIGSPRRDVRCCRGPGHAGDHRNGGHEWTDAEWDEINGGTNAGDARISEMRAQAALEEIEAEVAALAAKIAEGGAT